MATDEPLLDVRDLTVEFDTPGGPLRAVDGVSFTIGRGECCGLIGESGSGKSVTALSLGRLVPARRVTGEVRLDGLDVLRADERRLRSVRGGEIGFVFQDPMSCLNPALSVGRQIAEAARLQLRLGRKEAWARAVELLGEVGIPRPADRARDYPHQFSGGMRQRVMIAIALAGNPRLLVADEPTTALDVTIQAQILDLIRRVSAEHGTAVLMITHDLGIAAGLCDRINVMYAGQIVESAAAGEIFSAARMPYAWGLLESLPRLDRSADERLHAIPGGPPMLTDLPRGCRFSPRCTHATDRCHVEWPELTPRGGEHLARCFGTEPGGWLA